MTLIFAEKKPQITQMAQIFFALFVAFALQDADCADNGRRTQRGTLEESRTSQVRLSWAAGVARN